MLEEEGPSHPAPIHEGLGATECVEVFAWPARGQSKLLTLWALLHIFLVVVKHFGSVVPLIDGFVTCERGITTCMIPTVAVVDLLYYLLSFV